MPYSWKTSTVCGYALLHCAAVDGTGGADVLSTVFYCGEYYLYDVEQLQEINERPYSERIHNAQKEILSSVMIAKGGGEMSIVLDESRIEDMQYISEQFRQSKWCKPNDAVSFDWLNPIRLKLNS